MLRIQIKNKEMLLYFIIELVKWGYAINIKYAEGDCLYISMEKQWAILNSKTDEAQVMEIDEKFEGWLYNIFKQRSKIQPNK